MTTPTTKSLRTTTAGYTDDAMNAAESALDSTRQIATQVIGRAGDKARELGVGARDFASKGLSVATDATAAAQKQLSRYADVTGRYVSQQPVRSTLIAVAAGAAIAALVIAARRRNSRY